MPLDHVLARLDAATGILTGADPQTFEQSESELKAALDALRLQMDEPFPGREELLRAHRKCHRLAGLASAAEKFYLGLVSITNIQVMGYGSTGAKSRSETGKRFVVDA